MAWNILFKRVHDACNSDPYCWEFQWQNLVIPVLCNMYCEITKEFKTSDVF